MNLANEETAANAALIVEAKQFFELFEKFCTLPHAKLARTVNQSFWEASVIPSSGVLRVSVAKTPQEAIAQLFAAYPQLEAA